LEKEKAGTLAPRKAHSQHNPKFTREEEELLKLWLANNGDEAATKDRLYCKFNNLCQKVLNGSCSVGVDGLIYIKT